MSSPQPRDKAPCFLPDALHCARNRSSSLLPPARRNGMIPPVPKGYRIPVVVGYGGIGVTEEEVQSPEAMC